MRRLAEFFQLPASDRRLFITAFLLSAVLRIGLTFLPYGQVRKGLARIPSRWVVAPCSADPQRVLWAVKAAAEYVPGASCLIRALTAETLYHARGWDARTCFGAARNPEGRMEAHAWLEADGRVVLGAVEAGKYTSLLNS